MARLWRTCADTLSSGGTSSTTRNTGCVTTHDTPDWHCTDDPARQPASSRNRIRRVTRVPRLSSLRLHREPFQATRLHPVRRRRARSSPSSSQLGQTRLVVLPITRLPQAKPPPGRLRRSRNSQLGLARMATLHPTRHPQSRAPVSRLPPTKPISPVDRLRIRHRQVKHQPT